MLQFRKEISALLAALTGMETQEIESSLEVPPAPEMGQYAFPCFLLSRRLKKPPPAIAEELASKIEPGEYLERAENKGPYLNFFVRVPQLARRLLPEVITADENYGRLNRGEGKTVLVDFSAPNIAKPFGVGHLRSTVIGNALYRIYKALGYRVVGINHLGDWGTQFGKLIVAFRRWGEQAELEKDPVHYLYHLYVHFHQEAEKDPSLEEEARTQFRNLEKGDRDALELWKGFRSLSLEEFQRLYRFMGIEFDSYHGESFYNDRIEETIKLLQEKGLATESQGALVADLEPYGLPSCLLRKSDGAALYITRDLTAAIYRFETYGFTKLFYVVGAEQTLHFKQLFKILELLGLPWAGDCFHVPFGLIYFKDGRMSTREGKVIFLEEVLTRARELAFEIIKEKNPSLAHKEEVARKVGLGAVIFGDLINDRIKDVEFDWEKVLDFSGETAPYIQYSHARICSILRRGEESSQAFLRPDGTANAVAPEELPDTGLLSSLEEQELLITMARFQEAVIRSAEELRPSVLARYLVELARDFNKFYHNRPVLTAEGELKEARLLLISSVRIMLRNGLELLGVEAPEEM